MDSGPGRPGSLADRGLLPFSSGSCLGSAWWRSLRKGYCHDLGLLLFLSLSHSVVRTHTHTLTHTHTHAYRHIHLSLSPTCLSFQSAFALLCSDTCSHSSNHFLYLQRLCLRLSVGLLYVMHYRRLRIRTLSCLAWSC